MITQKELERVFDKYQELYTKIFKKLYPARNSTGFPERNLSVNFSKAIEKLYPSAYSWFEYQFGDGNPSNNKNHYDAVVFIPDTKTIFVVESKRLNDIRGKTKQIEEDMARINRVATDNKENFQYRDEKKTEERIPDFDSYSVYGVVLADVWTETPQKTAIKESFETCSFLDEYIKSMKKHFEDREGHYFSKGFAGQTKHDTINDTYYLVSMVWKVI